MVAACVFLEEMELGYACFVFLTVLPMMLPNHDPCVCRFKFVAGRILRSPAQ
jgi:hypothetical protein